MELAVWPGMSHEPEPRLELTFVTGLWALLIARAQQ